MKQPQPSTFQSPVLGASTLCLLFLPWREAIKEILAQGFAAVELFCDAPQAHFTQLSAEDRRALKSFSSQCELSLHAPTFELNVASANPDARAEAVRQYCQAVRLAAAVGARRVVVHEGHMSYWKLDRRAARQAAVDGLSQVVALAKQEGVTIALENTNYGKFAMYETWQEWISIATDLHDPALRLTLDTGHRQIAGCDIAAVIRALGAQIAQIHISDNKGTADDHLLPGSGVVNWQAITRAVGETGCRATWILESGPFSSVEELRVGKERMEQYWTDPGTCVTARASVRILVSNDDGVHFHGLWTLVEELVLRHQVTVIAPDREQSGIGTAISLHGILRARAVTAPVAGVSAYAVEGTPGDCVSLGLGALAKESELVVSGINEGSNLGDDAFLSGTVGAAFHAFFRGVPAIAVSVSSLHSTHFDPAARVVSGLVDAFANGRLPRRVLLNVNVPDIPAREIRGVRVTRPARRRYNEQVREEEDARGKTYYWIVRERPDWEIEEGTDISALQNGFISIVPLRSDMRDEGCVPSLESLCETLGRTLRDSDEI